MCVSKFETPTHIDLQRDGMDSKSVELRFMSVRVGLGVPQINFSLIFNISSLYSKIYKITYQTIDLKKNKNEILTHERMDKKP